MGLGKVLLLVGVPVGVMLLLAKKSKGTAAPSAAAVSPSDQATYNAIVAQNHANIAAASAQPSPQAATVMATMVGFQPGAVHGYRGF